MCSSYYLNIFVVHDCILLFKQTHSCVTPWHRLLTETLECVFNDTDNLRFWQARPLWRRTLRYWGWLRRTAQEPACIRPPQVCVCVRTIHSLLRYFNAFFDCTCSAADRAINQAAPLNLCFCVCVGACVCVYCVSSGAERVCPSGASARGREDHCGGDEEQRADGHWGKVSTLLLQKIHFDFCYTDKPGFVFICVWTLIFSVIRLRNVILIL